MLNKSFLYFSIVILSVLSCINKDSSIDKHVSRIVDSLSTDKKYSKKIFIVQHQSKWNKSYIKVSTAEFFDKDSASHYTSDNENLIVYYSNFFKMNNKKENIDKYDNFVYKRGIISIFHPRYVILEINKDGDLSKIVNKEVESQLFQYGNTYVQEPLPNHKK